MKLLSLSLVLAACAGDDPELPDPGQRSAPKLSLIERGTTRMEVTYRGDQIDRVTRLENGVVVGTAVFTYGAAGVERIERSNNVGGVEVETRAYDDEGRLVHQRLGTRDVTLSYDGERPKRITFENLDGSTSRMDLSYNDEGLMTKQSAESSDRTFRYDDAGHLTRSTWMITGDPEANHSYTYAGGRLDSVIGFSGSFELAYDAEGRIIEIQRSNETIRYTYAAGSVHCWAFTPDLPSGELFDLTGTATFPITRDGDVL